LSRKAPSLVTSKHLHPAVAGVGHDDVARGGIHGYVAWFVQLAVAAAALPELEQEGPNAAKHLHAIVEGVGHDDVCGNRERG